MKYIELHARSSYSFLAGASPPEDIVTAAIQQEIPSIAILDRNNLAGAVRFYKAGCKEGIKPILGAEIALQDGSFLPLLVATSQGYKNLCRLITHIKMRDGKEVAAATDDDLAAYAEGLICLTGDHQGPFTKALALGKGTERLEKLMEIYGRQQVYLELQRHYERNEELRNQALIDLGKKFRLPLLATNGVCYANHTQRELFDVLTCIRHKTKIATAGRLLSRNSQRHVKSHKRMEILFSDLPAAIANTLEVASRLEYSLRELSYRFPQFPVPEGDTMDSFLRQITIAGALRRYRSYQGRVREQIEKELALIEKLKLAGYFLIVWEMVRFCQQQGILVQGRGSAANSAVCYSLEITAVDPIAMDLLFERFLSEERGEWPDIDLDLPSGEQREAVIQHIYERYGKSGAAMTANHITYRGRSAVREIGKVLGFAEDQLGRIGRLIPTHGWSDVDESLQKRFSEAGFDLRHPQVEKLLDLVARVQDLPRHLGQHSGGMVICQEGLDSIVPLEPATMPGRVIIQWDKEDIADMGIIKVDLLGLGMMAVLAETTQLIQNHYQTTIDLAHLPADDPKVYHALQKGDTVGWFQVESRAQMSCLPRTCPTTFYDLVVQVAIIRPGPIVGKMANPYIKRRQGKEPVDYWHPSLEPVLARTLGIPLFQEQLMRVATTVAGFTGGEAEELRRTMGSKRSLAAMKKVEEKLRRGMDDRNIVGAVQEQIVRSITSFATYGFPESHAASFALLAYASGYLKCHFLAAYIAAMLNNQPMGFYSPATLVKDAQRHGLRFRPVDVNHSHYHCTVEEHRGERLVRLGLNYVRALRTQTGQEIEAERRKGPFLSIQNLVARIPSINKRELRNLSATGALNQLRSTVNRRNNLWNAELALRPVGPLLQLIEEPESSSPLKPMTEFELLNTDLKMTGVTLGKHPIHFFRSKLDQQGIFTIKRLGFCRNGWLVQVAGVVICRQRPETANGILFLSLEDETGIVNIIIMPDLSSQKHVEIIENQALIVTGLLQNQDGACSVKALQIRPLKLQLAAHNSHDFH